MKKHSKTIRELFLNFLTLFRQNSDDYKYTDDRLKALEGLVKINVLTVRVRQEPALAVQAGLCGEAQLTVQTERWRDAAGRTIVDDHMLVLPPSESPRRAVTHAALPPLRRRE